MKKLLAVLLSGFLCLNSSLVPVLAEEEPAKETEEISEVNSEEKQDTPKEETPEESEGSPEEEPGETEENPGEKTGEEPPVSEEVTSQETEEAGTEPEEEIKEETKEETEKETADESEKFSEEIEEEERGSEALDQETDYEYFENYDGTLTISKYNGTDKVVQIPSEINGKTVSEIGPRAFEEGSAEEVDVPSSVKIIGNYAFSESYLTKITLHEGLTSIGDHCFFSTYLSSIEIPDTVTWMGSSAFEWCQIKEVKLSENLKILPKNTFIQFEEINELRLPDGIEKIEEEAFVYLPNLKTISIGNKVNYIGRSSFMDWSDCEITFRGTCEEWKNIIIDDSSLLAARITCTDGVIDPSEKEELSFIYQQGNTVAGKDLAVLQASVYSPAGSPSFLWQYSNDNGETWIDLEDEFQVVLGSACTYFWDPKPDDNRLKLIRCIVKDPLGNELISDTATVTVPYYINYDPNGERFKDHEGEDMIEIPVTNMDLPVYSMAGDGRLFDNWWDQGKPLFAGWAKTKENADSGIVDVGMEKEILYERGDMLDHDIILYAVWVEGCYVNFDLRGSGYFTIQGDDTDQIWDKYCPGVKNAITLPDGLDYSVIHHNDDPELSVAAWTYEYDGKTYTVEANYSSSWILIPPGGITLKPIWEKLCTVYLDLNGGHFAESQSKYNTTVPIKEFKGRTLDLQYTPVNEGKKLLGWSESKDSKVPEYESVSDLEIKDGAVYYAIWGEETEEKTKVTGVSLDAAKVTIGIGESRTIHAIIEPEDATDQRVKWSSDHPETVSVSKNGTITGAAAGTAVITVETVDGGKTASCAVKVIAPLEKIEFAEPTVSLIQSGKKKLQLIFTPDEYAPEEIKFSSGDESVVTIDQTGTVKAIGAGTAVITAESQATGLKAECRVTVIANEITIEGLKDSYDYTGSAVKPVVQVYDSGVLLAEKTDYTISYKNNTNAGDAVLIVNGKGSYAAKKEFPFVIEPADIRDASVDEITLIETAKAVKLSPKVIWNGKTLKDGTDYEIDAKDLNPASAGDYDILVKGKGNFREEKTVTVHVLSPEVKSVTRLKVSAKAITYKEGISVDDAAAAVTVKDGNHELTKDEDYFISNDHDCDRAGTCTFVLSGDGKNYFGTRTVSVNIKGTSISGVKVTGSAVYDGNPKELRDGIVLSLNKRNLEEGTDFEVLEETYENNINAGKASVTVRGLKGISGTKKITFTIAPDTGEKEIQVSDAVYAKGGAIPEVSIDGLREGADYKLSFSNNKKVGTGTVTITFLSNYKRPSPVRETFEIKEQNLGNVYVTAPDPVWKKSAGNYKAKISVFDLDGKKLSAGSDYDKNIMYLDEEGREIGAKANLPAGSLVTAVLTGKGGYTENAEITYMIKDTVLDLSKANIKIYDQEYTGEAIELDGDDISSAAIKIGKETRNLEYGKDYEVLVYENNDKKGTAKVTFIGAGEYSGTKTVSFKIKQKTITVK